MIAEEGKAGRKVGEKWSAKMVPSPAASNTNNVCESFMKTLKWEEVYRSEYRDLQDARLRIGEFLEKVYNEQRLHSALGYVSPVEFERAQRAEQKMAGVA